MSDPPSSHIGHVDALNLTVSLCLCYTICIALVRLWIRRGAFGIDDLVVLVATVVTLSHTGTSYAALADGIGKPWIDIKANKDLAKLNAVCLHRSYPWLKTTLTSPAGIDRRSCHVHHRALHLENRRPCISKPHN